MHTVLSLLKLQIDNKTDILKTATPSKMAASIFKVLVYLILATVAAYVVLFEILFVGITVNAELLGLVLLVTQVVSVIFATARVINTLYMCKDNQMLICLPVRPNELFISKLLLIYSNEFAANAFVCIPIFVTLGLFSSAGIVYYLSLILLLFFLPILPIVIAALLSVPLMALIGFLKKHSVISIVSILVLVTVAIFAYVSVIGNLVSEFDIVNKQYETVFKINTFVKDVGSKIPVYYQLGSAMRDISLWYYYAIFLVICAAVTLLTILFTRHFFFKLSMKNLENTISSKPRRAVFKRSSVFASLIKKELLCVFRSPSDVFEYFLFTLLMPFIVFSYDRLLMSIAVNLAGEKMIVGAHIMVVAILAMLSNISSASAVSRDGGNFHSSKTMPVDYYTQMFAKLSFNAIFTLGSLVLTTIISIFVYPGWEMVLGMIAISFAAVGHIAYSIDMDLKDPTVNLQGDEQSSAVSRSTPRSIVSGLIIGVIIGAVVILMASAKNAILPYVIIIVGSLLFMLYALYTLILRINSRYDKIEM